MGYEVCGTTLLILATRTTKYRYLNLSPSIYTSASMPMGVLMAGQQLIPTIMQLIFSSPALGKHGLRNFPDDEVIDLLVLLLRRL